MQDIRPCAAVPPTLYCGSVRVCGRTTDAFTQDTIVGYFVLKLGSCFDCGLEGGRGGVRVRILPRVSGYKFVTRSATLPHAFGHRSQGPPPACPHLDDLLLHLRLVEVDGALRQRREGPRRAARKRVGEGAVGGAAKGLQEGGGGAKMIRIQL